MKCGNGSSANSKGHSRNERDGGGASGGGGGSADGVGCSGTSNSISSNINMY